MKRLHTIAALVLALSALASPAMAACKDYPIVTPDNAPVNRIGTKPGADPGWTKFGNMASTLRVCTDPNSTHPFREALLRNGACDPNGDELVSLAQPVTGTVEFVYVTLDGDVPDIERHRLGFNSPIAIPKLGVVKGFNPVGPYIPGAC